jgi:peptide/nickel transport system permease protein
LRRLVQALPLLLGISIASFALMKAIPGGPLAAYEAAPDFSDADLRRLEHTLGLDQPLPIQYLNWLGKFVAGDWGYSFVSHQPVLSLIGERLPNTVYLMGTVFITVLVLSIPIGVFTAVKQYSWFDHIVTGSTYAFLSTPTFWLGLLLIIFFGLQLRWLPLGGMTTPGASPDLVDRLRHLILPVATIAIVQLGSHVRYLRSSMLALKNASIPLVTVIALDIPELFAGAIVTEQIYGWPGMGRLFFDAATRLDYPILMGILAVTSTLIVASNLFADVVYGYLDPRIRYS